MRNLFLIPLVLIMCMSCEKKRTYQCTHYHKDIYGWKAGSTWTTSEMTEAQYSIYIQNQNSDDTPAQKVTCR